MSESDIPVSERVRIIEEALDIDPYWQLFKDRVRRKARTFCDEVEFTNHGATIRNGGFQTVTLDRYRELGGVHEVKAAEDESDHELRFHIDYTEENVKDWYSDD